MAGIDDGLELGRPTQFLHLGLSIALIAADEIRHRRRRRHHQCDGGVGTDVGLGRRVLLQNGPRVARGGPLSDRDGLDVARVGDRRARLLVQQADDVGHDDGRSGLLARVELLHDDLPRPEQLTGRRAQNQQGQHGQRDGGSPEPPPLCVAGSPRRPAAVRHPDCSSPPHFQVCFTTRCSMGTDGRGQRLRNSSRTMPGTSR